METIYKSKTLLVESDNVGATYINNELVLHDKNVLDLVVEDYLDTDTCIVSDNMLELIQEELKERK